MTAPKPFGLAAHLRSGGFASVAWMQSADPLLAEVFAREAFGAVLFDVQHGAADMAATFSGISAVHHAGKPACVRLALNDASAAARYLDNGAECVIAPMINTAEEARSFAMAVKYPPLGERSWGAGRALMLTGQDGFDYIQTANERTLCMVMIETVEALNNIDAIVAVEGIDGVFLGPSDLSIALNKGARLDPHGADVMAAAERILTATKAKGKIAGCYGSSLQAINDLRAKGWQFISVMNDLQVVRDGIRAALAALEPSRPSR